MSVGPNAELRLRSMGGEGETRRARGWVPASARTTDGEGMDSRPRLYGGRPRAGITGVGVGMTGRGFCGAGAVTGRATTRVAPMEKGFKGKAILRWVQNRIGLGEAKKENENRVGLSVGPNAEPRLRSTGGEEARRDRGWVPASARTTDGEGMDSRPRLYGGRLYAGMTGWARGWEVGDGDGSPHPRGQRMGKGWIPASVFTGAGSTRE